MVEQEQKSDAWLHAQVQASHNHNSSDDNWDSFNDGGFPDDFDDSEPNLPPEGVMSTMQRLMTESVTG